MQRIVAKLTCLKAMPSKAWVRPYTTWLIGDGKGSSEQRQGQSSIISQQASGSQTGRCRTVLDHDQIQGCEEVIDDHCHIAI